MLKTLEEPPEHVKFILATTDPQRLPVTVLSRCLQFNLKPLPPPLIAGHLKNVLDAEKHRRSRSPRWLQLGKAAAGSLRDSLSLLDQAIAHGGGKVSAAHGRATCSGSLGRRPRVAAPRAHRRGRRQGRDRGGRAHRRAQHLVRHRAGGARRDPASRRARAGRRGARRDDDADARARRRRWRSASTPARVQVMYQIAVARPARPAARARRIRGLHAWRCCACFPSRARRRSRARCASGPRGAQRARRAPACAARTAPAAARAAAAAAPAAHVAALQPRSAAAACRRIRRRLARPSCERSSLTGMAGMVARHGELASFENNLLELVVPETHRMYAEKPYLDKLKAELAPHFGAGLRLTVRVGTTAGTSVAAAKSREKAQRQASAAEAIEDDPFVRDLVRDLGAEVVPSSIRPADEAPGGQTERQEVST